MSDDARILAMLPHGPAARMISGVVAHSAESIETEMRWTADDPRIGDHFTGGPYIVPAVFLAEQAAQSALLLALLTDGAAPGEHFMLGQIRCDCHRPARAPCTVRAHTVLTAKVRGSVGFMAECFADGLLAARIKGVALRAPDV